MLKYIDSRTSFQKFLSTGLLWEGASDSYKQVSSGTADLMFYDLFRSGVL